MKKKVVHITTVHQRYDPRVFVKQCVSLTKMADVELIVADGKGNEERQGVNILDIGKPSGRLQRYLQFRKKALKQALLANADVYELHDPELLSVGIKLARRGKKVIYDVHEDYKSQILEKKYLPKPLRYFFSHIYERLERRAFRCFSHVLVATPTIRRLIEKRMNAVSVVCNYPIISEFVTPTQAEKKQQVCYVGSVSHVRGIDTILKAAPLLNVEVKVAGPLHGVDASIFSGIDNVSYLGVLDRQGVSQLIRESLAGICLLQPLENYKNALPVKMFEYMAAGVPVVASDFELWKQIIADAKCGITLPHDDAAGLAATINDWALKPNLVEEYGRHGQQAILKQYNWRAQEEVLFSVYEDLLA